MASPYKTTVVTVAGSRDLTTLETVKQELSITDSSKDAFIDRLIAEMSAFATTYCQRQFAQETLVDSFRPKSTVCSPLILSRAPVTSITSIVENGTALGAGDYEYDPETGFVWRLNGSDQRIAWQCGKIEVTFVGGYELLGDLPFEVERGVIEMVKEAFFAKTRDPMVKAEDVEGIGRQEFWVGNVPGGGAISQTAARYLDPHRRSLVL